MAEDTKEKNARAPVEKRALPLERGVAPSAPRSTVSKSVVSVLLFEVGGAQYAISVETTEGVVECPRTTPLPGPPDGVVGLTSVRGRMTVVMDLGLETRQDCANQRLILVRSDAQLGLLADRVEGVVALEPKKVRPVAHGKDSLTSQHAEFGWPAKTYFKCEGQRVPILDVERLGEE